MSTQSSGIRTRLLAGFAAVAVVIVLAVSAILLEVMSTERYTNYFLTRDMPLYDRLLDLGQQVNQSQALLFSVAVTDDPGYKSQYEDAWGNINRIQLAVDELLATTTMSDIQPKWVEIKSAIGALKALQNKALSIPMGADKIGRLSTIIKETNVAQNKLLDILDGPVTATGERTGGLYDAQRANLEGGANNILQDLSDIKLIEYLLIVVVLLTSGLIALVTAQKIVKPLNKAIDIAKSIASGERNATIVVSSNDETGQLLQALATMQAAIKENEEKIRQSEAHSRELFDSIIATAKTFSTHSSKVASGDLRERLHVSGEDVMVNLGKDLNTMTEGLATITKQITDACQNMVTTLEEVKQAVDVQSTGATEQASSINQITASLEEIEKSSSQTMDKAKSLGESAEKTREKGQQGLEAVEQSIHGMKAVREKVQLIAQTILELSNQTQQVGEITSVVNTLAQQSKMLALNASIEAAKAGEAGKGFAVVASEVKNLAEQSEQSTSQVQKILEDIRRATEKAVMVTEEGTKGVDEGTGLVEQTGDIVRSLSDVIRETTIASQQIEAAVRQEGVGIEQITAGMNEINQVTNSFVASANQTMDAINHLAVISKNLKNYVDTYKV